MGKPEPLKFDFSGLWSRRINQEHRLIYQVLDADNLTKFKLQITLKDSTSKTGPTIAMVITSSLIVAVT